MPTINQLVRKPRELTHDKSKSPANERNMTVILRRMRF